MPTSIPVRFKEAGLVVPVKATPWPHGRPYRVSINSFGLGGANAHVILDAATYASRPNGPVTNGHRTNGNVMSGILTNNNDGNLPTGNARTNQIQQYLLVFSSHSETSLEQMISNYQNFIESEPFEISDLVYTLNVRRHHQNVRTFCVTDGKSIQVMPIVRTLKFKGLLFIFTGQGAQWAGMGRELIQDLPTFREDIQKMDLWLSQLSRTSSWKIEGNSALNIFYLMLSLSENPFGQRSCENPKISIQQSTPSQSAQQSSSDW